MSKFFHVNTNNQDLPSSLYWQISPRLPRWSGTINAFFINPTGIFIHIGDPHTGSVYSVELIICFWKVSKCTLPSLSLPPLSNPAKSFCESIGWVFHSLRIGSTIKWLAGRHPQFLIFKNVQNGFQNIQSCNTRVKARSDNAKYNLKLVGVFYFLCAYTHLFYYHCLLAYALWKRSLRFKSKRSQTGFVRLKTWPSQ